MGSREPQNHPTQEPTAGEEGEPQPHADSLRDDVGFTRKQDDPSLEAIFRFGSNEGSRTR